ncbi:hypothetical protein KIN_29010 [Litoreibacter roseus]|uniref:Uncharacterized protein n=1 Tax=Litoreibacter roseus TaxID=2601869 RepID=A0A6N6JIQ3_9RHOB|nr:hypothetical protein KIN_29010 [Litoreibacter roseus]
MSVVLPASGCEMMAKVRRRAISGGSSGWLEARSNMGQHIETAAGKGKWARAAPDIYFAGPGPSCCATAGA